MRKKIPKLIISFETTLAALALEKVARPGLGRIIPLPARISAGCGLAFCADVNDKKEIAELMTASGIKHNDIHIVELFDNFL